MKKLLLLFVVLSGIHITHAQMHFGFFAGPSVSILTAGNEASSKAFVTAGAYMDIKISKYFSIQPNVMYSRKGGKAEINKNIDYFVGYANKEAEFTLDYLDIPLYLQFQTKASKFVSVTAFTGPYIGFNLKSEVEELDYIDPSEKIPVTVETKDTEYGISFGAAIKLNVGRAFLVFGVRTNTGFTQIFKNEQYASYKNMITAMIVSYEYAF